MAEQEFISLLKGFKQQTLTAEELDLFFQLAERPEFHSLMGEAVLHDLKSKSFSGAVDGEREQKVWQLVESEIATDFQSADNDSPIDSTNPAPPVHRIHFLPRRVIKTAWFKYAAAIILFLGVGGYFWKINWSGNNIKPITENKPAPVKDIAPGGQKALLKLADGSTIVLDNAANGQLALQPGSSVIKQDGQVIYDAHQQTTTAVYNTMSTPKGGQYILTLADGTKVWLNAASSITYPTSFIGNNRTVTITGEVYFEVTNNKEKPFIVKTVNEEITVLGTSFNVNSYSDEPVSKTSLIEGSVKIMSALANAPVREAVLKPGEAYSNGKVIPTNIEQDIAWKNGYFNFNGADLPMVLRQLGRWYDVEIKYENNVRKRKFRGKLSRNLTLTEILDILKLIQVKFEIKGKTLFVE